MLKNFLSTIFSFHIKRIEGSFGYMKNIRIACNKPKTKDKCKHYLREWNSPKVSGNNPNKNGSNHQILMIGTIFSLTLQD